MPPDLTNELAVTDDVKFALPPLYSAQVAPPPALLIMELQVISVTPLRFPVTFAAGRLVRFAPEPENDGAVTDPEKVATPAFVIVAA